MYVTFPFQQPNLDPEYPRELTVLKDVYDDVVKVEFRFSSPQVNVDVSEIYITACQHPGECISSTSNIHTYISED